MFCSNCGSQITEGNRFCMNCGASIDQFRKAVRLNGPMQGSSLSYANIFIYLLQILGAVLAVFTRIIKGNRFAEYLSPFLGWERHQDDVFLRGMGDLKASAQGAVIVSIFFVAAIIALIIMGIMKRNHKTQGFLALITYALYLVILMAVVENTHSGCEFTGMAYGVMLIYFIAAFISLAFSGKKVSSIIGKIKTSEFNGKRLGVIAGIVALLPTMMLFGAMMGKTSIPMIYEIIIDVAFLLALVCCIVMVGVKNNSIAIVILTVVEGIGSLIAALMVAGSLFFGLLSLVATVMMICACISMLGSQKAVV